MDISEFDYDLPAEAIAQEPIEPRDASRLLVVPGLVDRVFRDLPDLLEPGDVLVVNRTRVRSARLHARKDTGGVLEVLVTRRLEEGRWEALVRPARRVRPGTAFTAGSLRGTVVTGPERGRVEIELEVTGGGDVEAAIERHGTVPLPPYIHDAPADPERYQTVYATSVGSAAAPTAGLHVTEELMDRLAARGVEMAPVELDVGLATFLPMQGPTIDDHPMHVERYAVPPRTAAAVERARAGGGRVVAVGTTVVRTLEAASATGRLVAGEGETDLFITPGHRFRSVDAVVTNFHAPRTTLLVMLAAMVGDRWRAAYRHALDRGYRFLSFGDAMYIAEVPR